jgi:hypothetical protein
MPRKTDPAHAARNDLRTLLRTRIDTAIADLSTWGLCNFSVTTATDCRIEYHQILGMIDAAETIGDDIHGLRAKARRALDSALSNCPEVDDLLDPAR